MTNFKKLGLVAVPGALALVGGAAHADVPAEFTTAITEAAADVATMAGGLVTVAVVGVAFMIAIKFIKRIRSAA